MLLLGEYVLLVGYYRTSCTLGYFQGVLVFKTGSHCLVLAGLELAM